jgi:WD40 repeat protein
MYDGLPSRIIQVVLSPDRRILLNADRDSGTINVFYSGTGDTDNMDFSYVTHFSIPNPKGTNRRRDWHRSPLLAFSADGAKFASVTGDGVVLVWDVRSKIPLKVFEAVPRDRQWPISHLQFSSGILGREVLVFTEVSSCFSFPMYLRNKWPLVRSFNSSEHHPPS